MREKFELWFVENFPGMTLDGPTARDAWRIWRIAYLDGAEDAIITMAQSDNAMQPWWSARS